MSDSLIKTILLTTKLVQSVANFWRKRSVEKENADLLAKITLFI